MAGKITALKVQKKNRDRVSVFLDDRFAFGIPAIVAARLKRGQLLSDEEIEALKAEGESESAYSRTLNYLSYRPRSQAEIVTYLQKREVSAEGIDLIVERLERAGLLDDEAFAQYWVENRERFRPRGPRALRYELRQKGVSAQVIEQALDGMDVVGSAHRAAEKKVRQLRNVDEQTFRRKLMDYLARRGFDYAVAREVTDRHWRELAADG
ncbi:MAG: RecX family transcriptional regulator [Anaerolineae bacterium]|jgi:regulatory protein